MLYLLFGFIGVIFLLLRKITQRELDAVNKETKGRREKKFSPNVNVWLEVKADIEIKIIVGEFPAGGRMPSIVKIAEMYGVGKTTAQKVLESLCEDGTIVNQKGVGYFVKLYEKERLLRVHEKELGNQFQKVIEYARKVGLSDEDVLRIVKEALLETGK